MVEGYATMARDNHAFAGFSKIRIDDAGEPDPNDLYLAWAGARVFRLVPQLVLPRNRAEGGGLKPARRGAGPPRRPRAGLRRPALGLQRFPL